MKKVILIDGNALMHRAYHAVKFAPVYNDKPIGMVFGFASMLINTIEFFHPDFLIIAFDTKEKTFRHKMDKNYKAHREKADDEFYEQIPLVFECIEHFHIPVLSLPGFEADDIIGTATKKAEKENFEIKIVSGDLDFLQLTNDKTKLAKPNGRIQDSILYGPKETKARYGVTVEQMVDYKALVGDSSDNYKGLPGCGPKNATKLLQKYGTIDKIYKNLENLNQKLQKKFQEHKEEVLHCRKLAKIKTDVPIEIPFNIEFSFFPEDTIEFFQKVNFPSLQTRYQKLIKYYDQADTSEQEDCPEKADNDKQMTLF